MAPSNQGGRDCLHIRNRTIYLSISHIDQMHDEERRVRAATCCMSEWTGKSTLIALSIDPAETLGAWLDLTTDTRNSAEDSLIFHRQPSQRCNIILHDAVHMLALSTWPLQRHLPYLARIRIFAAGVSALQGSWKPDVAHEDPKALGCALTALSTEGHARASGLVILVLSAISN